MNYAAADVIQKFPTIFIPSHHMLFQMIIITMTPHNRIPIDGDIFHLLRNHKPVKELLQYSISNLKKILWNIITTPEVQ